MPLPVVIIAFLGACEVAKAQARLRPPHVRFGAMDPAQHDRLLHLPHQGVAEKRMSPEMAHVLGGGLVCGLLIAQAPIANRLQLAKVTNQDNADVTERTLVRIKCTFAEDTPLGLLQTVVHARKESAANE